MAALPHLDNNNLALNRISSSVLGPFEYREFVGRVLNRQLSGLLMCEFLQGDSDSKGEAGWLYNWHRVIFHQLWSCPFPFHL